MGFCLKSRYLFQPFHGIWRSAKGQRSDGKTLLQKSSKYQGAQRNENPAGNDMVSMCIVQTIYCTIFLQQFTFTSPVLT